MSRRLARAVVYLGIAAVVLGLSKIHAAVIADPPYSFTNSFRFAWALAYILLLGVAAYGVGLPDLPRSARQGLQASATATVLAALALSLVQLATGDAELPRFVVFGSAILLVPWFLACVAFASDGASSSVVRDRVLVVSDTAGLSGLRHELSGGAERPARVVAVLRVADVEPREDGSQPLVDRATRERANVLVLDRDAEGEAFVVGQAAVLHHRGLRVRTMSLFYEEWLGKLPLGELERIALLFDIADVHRARYVRMKRLVDVVVAGFGALVFALAVPVVVVGNLVANRGPLFYTQARVGRGGAEFRIVKFRTMRAATEGAPNEWTSEDDPRITRFGRILRVTHLDELPQVLNILRGELSVVGPRPEQPHYVAELTEKLPYYDLRHLARPGLTGWAQVKYGYAGDEADAMEKLQYEFFYLRHQSLMLDARILVRTIRTVVGAGWPMNHHAVVTVVVPVRNEARDIAGCIDAIAAQDLPLDRVELLVVDGRSDDGTVAVATAAAARHGFARSTVLDNPARGTAAALNLGLAEARGSVVARVDARARIPRSYLQRCVAALASDPGAGVVGGAQVPVPRSPRHRDRAIARALANRYTTGLSRYRRSTSSGTADTVWLGVFRRDELRSLGGWDEGLSINEDYELNARYRAEGWQVHYLADQRCGYLPRETYAGLARQYYRFGAGKAFAWRSGFGFAPRHALLLLAPVVGAATGAVAVRRAGLRAVVLVPAGLLVADAIGNRDPAGPAERAGAAGVIALYGSCWWAGAVIGTVRARPLSGARS